IGMLIIYIWGHGTHAGHTMTLTLLLIWLALTVIITILDYVVPSYFTKVTGGSKYGGIGAGIGLVAGMFLTPIGMILGALIGAFLAELMFADKSAGASAKSALGAFLGFMFGMGMKLIASAIMMYDIVLYAF
ncbi:MAG: DUF456 domain-containing protein, partial [Bacteroidales bacterium]|nr:DUF456 domain-containing protein [Bacteroidales bacterium]